MLTALYARPPVLLTLVALMWASNAICGRLAVGEISPAMLVLARWLLVAVAMSVLFGREVLAHWAAARARLGAVVVMALAGFTGFNTIFYFAAQETTAVNIGIIQGAMPVLVLLGAYAVYRDRVRPMQMLGVAVTVLGVLLVASRGDLSVLRDLAFNDGDLLMLVAAALYSTYAVALRARPEMPGRALFTLFAIVAAVAAVPFAAWDLASGGPLPTAEGWAIAVWVALFPSCLAQLFFLRGVDLIGPGAAGIYINLVPVFASVLAVVLLGERFATYHAGALVLVLGGLWLAQRPPRLPRA